MKVFDKRIITSVIVIVSTITIVLLCSITKNDKRESALFEENRIGFELINCYILSTFDNGGDNIISLVRENNGSLNTSEHVQVYESDISKNTSKVISLYHNGEYISLSPELQEAFNNVDNAFEYNDFEYISITSERISYGGNGYKMYVYSKNGKTPDKYYYYENDGMHPSICRINKWWYLLEVNYR